MGRGVRQHGGCFLLRWLRQLGGEREQRGLRLHHDVDRGLRGLRRVRLDQLLTH
ncbi:hypothetical protein [Allokutzneria oryzae]|uniref:Uncharacterized protein n=1 Tax=Allokutzneria oryzae TaxID=1378989 RepID=A0ABV5ZS30_9PSEU